jgi:DNA invertase Pin-like site-specific DNA recombinase
MGGERLDTRNPTSKLMLTILAGVATRERKIMLERQCEGAGKYKGHRSASTRRRSGNCAPSWDPRRSPGKLGIARSSV